MQSDASASSHIGGPNRNLFLYGLRQQVRVIFALIVRETVTRYGKQSAGFLWAFVEPAAYIAFVIVIRTVISHGVPYGDNALVFVVAGLLGFRLYISIASRSLGAITSNQALLSYPLVRPLDVIFARVLLEAMIMLLLMGIIIFFLTLYLGRNIIVRPDVLVEGIAVTFFLALGIGSLNAVFGALLPSWNSMYKMLSLPIFLLSGVFYLPAIMPPVVLSVIKWNPILHCVEMVRASYYVNYLSIADPLYPITFATITFVIALLLERINRGRLIHL